MSLKTGEFLERLWHALYPYLAGDQWVDVGSPFGDVMRGGGELFRGGVAENELNIQIFFDAVDRLDVIRFHTYAADDYARVTRGAFEYLL